MIQLQRFLEFVRERENIRIMRYNKEPFPWTLDPVLQKYRFCNIERENDRTTKWIRTYIDYKDPRDYLIKMALVRRINRTETLSRIQDILNYENGSWDEIMYNVHQCISAMKFLGRPVISSAYLVVPQHSRKPLEVWLREDYIPNLIQVLDEHFFRTRYLNEVHDVLTLCKGIGDFMSGQIIADIKNCPEHPCYNAMDWWTFVVQGPGSLRGMNRLHGRDKWARYKKEDLEQFKKDVLKLRVAIKSELHYLLSAQDVQNCLCEFDKYCRAFENNGKGLRRYRHANH